MPKIPDCARCQFYAYDYHLVCVPHPDGPEDDTCPDFSPNLELKGKRFVDFVGLLQNVEYFDSSESYSNPFNLEPNKALWEPDGSLYYAGELILQPQVRWTQSEQLELLDTHPMFTGYCSKCGYEFSTDNPPQVHWDCPNCTWKDDSL